MLVYSGLKPITKITEHWLLYINYLPRVNASTVGSTLDGKVQKPADYHYYLKYR